MNLLDENFPQDQCTFLRQWRIPFRQLGGDIAPYGVKDDNVIPLLHARRGVTFFTQDLGFFQSANCHTAYCLVCLDVRADDAAEYVRRFLCHPRFQTKANRLGIVARVHADGIHFWQRHSRTLQRVQWTEP